MRMVDELLLRRVRVNKKGRGTLNVKTENLIRAVM